MIYCLVTADVVPFLPVAVGAEGAAWRSMTAAQMALREQAPIHSVRALMSLPALRERKEMLESVYRSEELPSPSPFRNSARLTMVSLCHSPAKMRRMLHPTGIE